MRELWHDEEEFLRAAQEQPERFADRVDPLDLPQRVLCHYLAPDEILLRVEDAIRAVSAKGEYPTGADPWPPISYWRALELLRNWPDDAVEPFFVNLLRCPDLHESVYRRVWDVAWERDWAREPGAMRQAIREWPLDCVLRRHAGLVVFKLAEDPEPQDRERFLWAARQRDKAEFRCLGIRALHRLGEASDEWDRLLADLIRDPDVAVRLAAAESLAARGDAYARELIRMLASQDHDLVARAEALRWMGEHRPAEAVPLLRRALLKKPAPAEEGCQRLCAMEAALQLALIGGPQALTVLLEAALHDGGWGGSLIRQRHLAVAAGVSSQPLPDQYRIRYNRTYAWRCC